MANYKTYLVVLVVSIIVIGIVAVAARYTREIRSAREALNNLGSQVIETPCGVIEYARVGNGYPVLVVHGTMGGFDQGLLLAKPIIDAGFQVISVSRFGFLRSPLPEDAGLNKQADTYACLLDALRIQQTAVFTFSAGANSSIRFAARYPERLSALILLSPAAPGKVKVATPPRAIFDTVLRSDFVFWAMITYFKSAAPSLLGVPKGFVLTPEFEHIVNEGIAKSLPISGRIDGFIWDAYTSYPEVFDEVSETSPYPLSNIKTPILVINALDDPYSNHENVRDLVEKFPNARLYTVPNGGHPLLGHVDDVNAEMVKFLGSIVAVPNSSR